MIRVTVSTRRGVLYRIAAEGHGSRGPDGLSAVCAAVSALLKGVGLSLLDSPGCTVEGTIEDQGLFDLTVTRCDDERWLRGLGDLTCTVLREIARQWPREIVFAVNEEKSNGT